MTHFKVKDVETPVEEPTMQKAKADTIAKEEKKIVAKEVKEQKKVDKILGIEDTSGTFNVKDVPSKLQGKQSLLYPISQTLQDVVIKALGDLEPATVIERENLRLATIELEKKYGVDKIAGPEANFVVAEVTPMIRQFDKLIPKLFGTFGNILKKKPAAEPAAPQPQRAAAWVPEQQQPKEAPKVDKSFHINPIQAVQ